MTEEDSTVPREREIAARIASLISDSDAQMDTVAADLTELYRRNIPVYDSVARDEVQRNTRAVLDIVVRRVRSDSPAVNEHDVSDLVRRWADQKIPLELIAHSIQLGARELFKVIRHNAAEQGLTSHAVDDMQDMMWEWATSYSAAVNTVMQERAVSGAARRADLIRQLVEGSYVPASLDADAREHGIVLDHPYHVACVAWDDSSVVSDVRAMLRIRSSTHELAVIDAVIDRHLVALLPAVPDRCDAAVPVGIGDARPAAEARSSHRQAHRALELATTFGKTGVLDLAALGPLPLLALGEDAADHLATAHLTALVERGAVGREIMDTVATYLDNDRRVDDTAAVLFVHRNTVRNRVARFGDLTGLDIDRTTDLVLAWWLLTRERTTRATLQDPAL
ncbi:MULTISPECIES: helix-turn-helix domain-containing protein [Rhodococcus]|uniref:Helix-turn-helix domain-containing protein n=1 Tax=Rhodococcus oxybenzonivorans TaxID=1990687 RepID=A0AAE5A5S4_9NOCA|nr:MULTISPECIES: helix-turn-helix domain-containing protein [Rhodococcus]MDV7243454.1 helix-turn-helix domain-containing protein [Rhodococcus oxybenzonivorans]MDV7265160.1 helix-turn-helix domain-containing protein [Rhodococcus oxybenzonivorans]MDV7277430.1 helix-turn-helix domain-containing protein [Rhodococcus oxybenzonivorans]MDV7335542.1 helix-turn-helix domain-containing protein [Rhodococcus oxybenzonivorans]MDV7347142.1 helix-turn-helix domain-containing protein [Rhodococcus oxybenzonivo